MKPPRAGATRTAVPSQHDRDSSPAIPLAEVPDRLVRVGRPLYGGSFEILLPEPAELPFVLEGELVRVGGSRPTLLEVLEPSPDRAQPGCRHFGLCGGCQYQHLSQADQLRTKAELLHALLRRANVTAAVQTVEAAEPWVYRNRVRLRVQEGGVGYNRRASHSFLAITECPILAPILWRAAQALQAIAAWPNGTTEVELFATGDESEVQLAIHVDANVSTLDRDAPQTFRALCAALQAKLPELAGGGLLVQAALDPAAPRRVQERRRIEVARWGKPGMVYRVQGRDYPVTRGAFFQVNRFLTGRLVELVLGDRRGSLAMDLFAGAGLFSLALAERFTRVVSVEVGEPSATDLARLMAGQRTVRQTTLAFLRDWNRGSNHAGKPDLVVVDPPRAGIGDAALTELKRLAAPEIVYVSCDPVSFAREARALVDSGYAVAELHALDLFPQTFHMETVAMFRRA